MRICWYDDHKLGLVRDGQVFDATDALKHLPPLSYPWPKGDPLIANLDAMGAMIEDAAEDNYYEVRMNAHAELLLARLN